MNDLLTALKIDPSLQGNDLYTALETAKHKVLRRLNNAFGNRKQEALLQEQLEQIEALQKSFLTDPKKSITPLTTGLVDTKTISIDDVDFSPQTVSQERPAYKAFSGGSREAYVQALKLIYGEDGTKINEAEGLALMKQAASEGSIEAGGFISIYNDTLTRVKNMPTAAKKDFDPLEQPLLFYKNEADFENAAYSAVFGGGEDYSVIKLATWLITKAIFQYLSMEAVTDEINLLMVRDLIDNGISDDSNQSNFDRLFQLLFNKDENHIAIKEYDNYKVLAPFHGTKVMGEAQKLFYYIGKPNDLLADVSESRIDEAVDKYIKALVTAVGFKCNAKGIANEIEVLFERYPKFAKERFKENKKVALSDLKGLVSGHAQLSIMIGNAMEFYAAYNDTDEELGEEDETSIDQLIRAANQGDVDAQRKLGEYYGGQDDYDETFKWYKMAADNGDFTSQIYVGVAYLAGSGTPQNAAEGLSQLKKASDQGAYSASEILATLYYDGHDGLDIPRDIDEGIKWHKLAAEQGSASSAVKLGGLFSTGDSSLGIHKNGNEALKYYKIAADQTGDDGLLYVAGLCYLGVHGCTPNMAEAKKYVQLAADKGNKEAKETLKEYFG